MDISVAGRRAGSIVEGWLEVVLRCREGGMQFVPEAVITCRQGHHHHRF